MSDNGAPTGQSSNAPLSGGKVRLTEGGIRVPFIIKGPNISANTYNTTPIVGYDLFPTFAALTGSNTPLGQDIDGENITPLFLNQTFERKEPLYFHSPHYSNNKFPVSAAIEGDYKLKVDYDAGTLQLYDLAIDIGETTDIAADNRTIFNRLRLELRNHLKDVSANMPTLDPTHADWAATVQPDDADGDGLNDVWEITNLLTHLDDGNGDPDNDGHTNLEEQNANTDPLVAEAIFACKDTFKLDNATFSGNQTIPAADILESEKNYSGGSILYTAGESITLKSGFTVENGVEFVAKIENCTPSLVEESPITAQQRNTNVEELENYSLATQITPKVIIFPNPSNGQTMLNFSNLNQNVTIQKVQVFNLNGKMLIEKQHNIANLDIGAVVKGIYFVRVQFGDEFITQKLIVN